MGIHSRANLTSPERGTTRRGGPPEASLSAGLGLGAHWPLQARRPAPQHHRVGQARSSKTSAARVQTEGWDLAEDHSFIQIQNSQKPKYCWVFFFFNFQALTASTYLFPLEALFFLLLFPEKEFSCLPFCSLFCLPPVSSSV